MFPIDDMTLTWSSMFLVLAQVAISVSSELSLELDRLANNRFTTPNVQHMVAVCSRVLWLSNT